MGESDAIPPVGLYQNPATPSGMGVGKKAAGDLVEAEIMVCCNHKRTAGACTDTIQALIDNFLNIREINGVKAIDGTEDMCVIGTALIRPSMRARFERDIKGMKIPGRNRRITKAVVTVLP